VCKIIGGFFALVACVLAVNLFYQYMVLTEYVRVDGLLENIDVIHTFGTIGPKAGKSYRIFAKYSYVVNNKAYQGSRVEVDGDAYGLESNAKKVMENFANSKRVDIWYDPSNPQNSFLLKPVIQAKTCILLFLTGLLSFMSFKYLDAFLSNLNHLLKLDKKRGMERCMKGQHRVPGTPYLIQKDKYGAH
jgi:hypothetical protein